MRLIETELKDAYIVEPRVFGDNRGWFMETYSKLKLINTDVVFIQDNQSYTQKKGTIRGLHCQTNPMCQTKLVRCTRGKIIDIIVDIRKGSPTYKKWIKVELSAENKRQLFIPKGFLHSFVSLTDDVEIQYKVDEYFSQECDRSIRYDDEEFGIDWGVENPILSDKDRNAPKFKDSDCHFEYKEK